MIVGGESGPKARPIAPQWVQSLRDQCQGGGVPFFFKQWGEWAPNSAVYDGIKPDPWEPTFRVGRRHAGRLLDGRTWDEMPA